MSFGIYKNYMQQATSEIVKKKNDMDFFLYVGEFF